MLSKIKEFVKVHEVNIILGIGVVLISLISFAAGYLAAREQLKGPMLDTEISNNRLVKTSSEVLRSAFSAIDPSGPYSIASESLFGNLVSSL